MAQRNRTQEPGYSQKDKLFTKRRGAQDFFPVFM